MSPNRIATVLRRAILAVAVVLGGIAPALGEPGYRMHLGFLKSTHPNSDRDYNTDHPSVGVSGPLAGEWLRWGVGTVRNSQSRWGPFAGAIGTFEIAEGWRAGLSAGIAGNYTRNNWLRVGVLPIVQWKDRESELVWEFGFAHRADATFAAVSVHVPFSVLETR